ncbi:hypothetical protein EPUL_001557 [Erysiphe pulchra]|uniref:Uncharacterized protein n=1 Tax=Erysiphe pulchra TaxID=225359 RepID=A0A2S4PWT4_9PEZI|nr:hypothetical protein EPUL_001557 [Erysiphe pulchra]
MSNVAGRLGNARRTRTKPIISYAEISSDSENEIDDEDAESETSTSRRIITRSHTGLLKRQRRSVPLWTESQDFAWRPISKKRRHISNPELKTSTNDTERNLGSSIIPPWQNLPYHILVDIFKFASYPIYNEHNFQSLPSGKWLLKVARMCRAFAEPALTVLYNSPPLVPMAKAHMLVDLLKADPITLAFKYRQKIVSLQIEVSQVASYILTGSGYLDIFYLVRDLPRLLDLEFYHQKDMIPYRNLDTTIKWSYPDSIFKALEYVHPAADGQRGDKTSICKLRSWRWSSRLAGKRWPLERLCEVHMKPSFRSMRKIAFVNYQEPSLKKDQEDPNYESILARAISILPNLEHLIFESSTLFNSKLLPLLPKNLRCLEVINCWEITSDDFADFLSTHGQQLRDLVLNYNQSLDLAFLPILGNSCPYLETFRMNMTCFSIHTSYQCSEPMFDTLLLPDQIPVWPKKLQIIELSQLRKWDLNAAEVFFSSLIDSAAELTDLRRLSIQAIINVGWRGRASFRYKWVGLLNRVFKRKPKPPEPDCSIRKTMANFDESSPIKSHSDKEATHIISNPKGYRNTNSQSTSKFIPPRRSNRSITRAVSAGKYAESISHGLARELIILRATGGVDLSASVSSSSASQSDESDSGCSLLIKKYTDKSKCQIIQGMCDTVEIRIDNLRPVENQITEADFVDEEVSGDEDWSPENDLAQQASEDVIDF